MGHRSTNALKKILNIIYMDSVCDEIKDDMHKMEEDSLGRRRYIRFNYTFIQMFYKFYKMLF